MVDEDSSVDITWDRGFSIKELMFAVGGSISRQTACFNGKITKNNNETNEVNEINENNNGNNGPC